MCLQTAPRVQPGWTVREAVVLHMLLANCLLRTTQLTNLPKACSSHPTWALRCPVAKASHLRHVAKERCFPCENACSRTLQVCHTAHVTHVICILVETPQCMCAYEQSETQLAQSNVDIDALLGLQGMLGALPNAGTNIKVIANIGTCICSNVALTSQRALCIC